MPSYEGLRKYEAAQAQQEHRKVAACQQARQPLSFGKTTVLRKPTARVLRMLSCAEILVGKWLPLASVLVAPPSSWPSRFCYQAALRSFGHGAFASLLASRAIAGGQYSLWGSNPRPMAHKTIALTTELHEHLSGGEEGWGEW